MRSFLFFWALLFFLFVFPAGAQVRSFQDDAPELGSRAAVALDATTGTVVFYKNPDEEIPPASLTKLMTMHLVQREIEAGRASLDEIISLPRESWAINQPPGSSLMLLANGQTPSLRDILLGMAVFSGNDAAMAAALRFAPSSDAFVEMMNREAAALGLSKTRFVDPAGYWEDNMTTARDFAEFCRLYIEAHPESIKDYHSVREFSYPRPENVAERYRENPVTRTQKNNNSLLGKVEGVDGLKTGYIPEAGYNIALTAERNDSRFVAVILGAPAGWGGDRIRDADGTKLLEWIFSRYRTIRPTASTPEPVRVWKGKTNFADIIWSVPLEFTALAERGNNMEYDIDLIEPLIAPLPAGSYTGDLVLYDSFGELRRIPLITVSDVERGGVFKRLFDSIRLFFRKIGK